ncbi:protein unc-93 homolog A-like [Rana temporaria]|uniref:protein unc-93 homolog A-like n=1 Tax=Rana temporaria TaxID=8407 RepID=UPI001AAE0B27|nr:protein unc-93 homolog A-like [Rana temporaria]XP_040206650.1 protein unc-93 homolog A-like [Rana temporaria]
MESFHLKNILVLSFGILLLYTAYMGLQTLQSSLNRINGLGVASLSVMYVSLSLSSLFLPPLLIKKIGCKWTIVASMFCFISYSLCNFYPSWPTLIISSVLVGLGGGPLWASKSTYITIIGNKYAETCGKLAKDVVNQYFGIFFLICQTCRVWGNLISSLVFHLTPNAGFDAPNQTICGAGDCPAELTQSGNNTAGRPSNTVIYILLGSYTACGVLAVLLIIIFMDEIQAEKAQQEDNTCSTLLAAFKHLRDKRQCLLIPLTMFSGFEQGFIASDFTKSYVTCILGLKYVGFVIICFGVTNSICAVIFGKVAQYTGRVPLFLLGAAINIGCIIGFLIWKPTTGNFAVFFVMSGLWGIADAVWQTLLSSLYGVLFEKNKEAAFANFSLWESLGFAIAFGYSSFLCVYIKLYILMCVVVVGILLYGAVEYIEHGNAVSGAQESPKD